MTSDPINYVKTYKGAIELMKVLSSTEYRVLHVIAMHLEYETNKIYIDKEHRIKLATLADTALDTINRVIPNLIREGFMIKVSSSMYQVNPSIYFSGNESERLKLIGLYKAILTNRGNNLPVPIVVETKAKQEQAVW